MLKSLYKVLTLRYISMTVILRNRHKTDISKFLKIVKFEGPKKHLKNTSNVILDTKHILDVCIILYITLKVYKYY